MESNSAIIDFVTGVMPDKLADVLQMTILFIATTGMVPGVYVLRLIEGEKERTQKIVIQ